MFLQYFKASIDITPFLKSHLINNMCFHKILKSKNSKDHILGFLLRVNNQNLTMILESSSYGPIIEMGNYVLS